MRAVVFEGVGRVAVREVPEPRVEQPDDVVLRVTATAICGSDLHLLHGKAPLDPGDVLGHEVVGVIEQAGPAVLRFREGERVVAAFDIVCGACWFCLQGQPSLCEEFASLGLGVLGGGLAGSHAEYVRIPHADANLLSVPPGMADERALLVGDVLTTGWYGASIADIREGDVVAVVGAGPVGLFCGQAARALGADRVLVLDREPGRLETAARLGLEPIDVRERNPQMAAARATGGRGADVAIEAVGSVAAFESALEVVRRGGTVSVVGMYTSESVQLQLGVAWARMLDLRFAGICPVQAWWEEAMAAVVDGRLDPGPIVSHVLSLDEAPRGFDLFDLREATKVVLRP